MAERNTPRQTGPKPGAPESEQVLKEERRALRELIEQIRREPGSDDDGGFYRNAGRFIIRPLMKPHWPGDKRH